MTQLTAGRLAQEPEYLKRRAAITTTSALRMGPSVSGVAR